MVRLFGEILKRNGTKEFLFSVAADLGDARDVGIQGQIWIPNKGAFGLQLQTAGPGKGYYLVRISFPLADLIAKRCQSQEP